MPYDPEKFRPSEHKTGPKGWYSRGYLPHRDENGLIQFLTFHEADALPQHLLDEWRDELARLPLEKRKPEEHRRIMKALDQCYGSCHLRNSEVAEAVQQVFLNFHGVRYDLEAWTIMPNHVHLVIRFYENYSMPAEIKSLKGVSANRANAVLGRRGQFWFREYYDRYIRDEEHYANVERYIDYNPVKAGFSGTPEEWPFGSAACSKNGGD